MIMKTMNTKSMILTVCALMICLQANAEFKMLEMRSTSAMQGTGSIYQPKVIAVDAPQVQFSYLQMQSTSMLMETGEIPTPFSDIEEDENYRQGPRRVIGKPGDPGDQSDEFPVGEPWVMLVFAAAAAATVAIRRRLVESRKQAMN